MSKTRATLVFLVLLAAVAGGCEPQRFLVGEEDGSMGPVQTVGSATPDGGSTTSLPSMASAPDGGRSAMPPAAATPPCSFGSAPMPARPVTVSASVLAARLSRLLWNAPQADAALIRRIEGLRTSDEVGQLAREMLADRRAGDGVLAFYRKWLGLDSAAGASVWTGPMGLGAQTQQSVVAETEAYVRHVVLDLNGSASMLLTSPFSFIDRRTAPLYGLTSSSTVPVKTALDPGQRAGVLTQPSWLVQRRHAILRGVWIVDQLLCSPLPPPPADVNVDYVVDPSHTWRQRLTAMTRPPACAMCHERSDPLGFGFEHYDELGRFRTRDNGQPVDATGDVRLMLPATTGAPGDRVMFAGAPQLMAQLANRCEVHACMAQNWLAHALDRQRPDYDDPNVRELAAAFTASGLTIRDLIVAVTQSAPFLAP